MSTRLRSDKGSFVRSPLGAFDSEAGEPPILTGTVVQVVNGALTGYVRTGVDGTINCRLEFGQPGGQYSVTFNFSGPIGITASQLLSGTFVGDTSGATYSPQDYFPLVKWCGNNEAPASEVWIGTDFSLSTPGLFEVATASQLCEVDFRQSSMLSSLNAGGLGFVLDEPFTFTG